MSEQPDSLEEFRRKLSKLEQRESELAKRVDRLLGRVEKFDPELNALMREGLPLDLFTRAALLARKYDVHGYYPYHYANLDGSPIERSVDIYASRDSIYTVPEGVGPRAGESWPERDNLLVECKQRKEGVRWLFCLLPTSKKEWSIAGEKVPVVNAGFELRPSSDNSSSAANAKDVKNAIAQLNEAYIPFVVSRELKDAPSHPAKPGRRPERHENTWLLLVTSATLKVFQVSASFEELLAEDASRSTSFVEVPWLIFKPDRTLSLMCHQQAAVSSLPKAEDSHWSVLQLLAENTHEVHVIQYGHLSEFLALVEDPPRVKSINVTFRISDGPESSFTIK